MRLKVPCLHMKWFELVWQILYVVIRECYFGIYFPNLKAAREFNTKITFSWPHKQFAMTVHTLSYFLHNIMNAIPDDKKMILTHQFRVSLALDVYVFYEVTDDCWWHHKCIIWYDNRNGKIYIHVHEKPYLSRSWDISFIHSHIRGRSCKKNIFLCFQEKKHQAITTPSAD